jgi:hypothetical protein
MPLTILRISIVTMLRISTVTMPLRKWI